ncbi:MAG: hypothetical protein J5I93_18830 [Pirellulaceae bacterium]|nr:hypothetical protein [Pirellulaceae bacterium]
MGRLSSFLAGLLVGAAVMFTALKYHVVRANDGWHLIPKLQSDFSQTYVDVRQFTPADWNEHRELAVAIVKADKGHLMSDSALGHVRQAVDSVLHNLGGPNTSIPGASP